MTAAEKKAPARKSAGGRSQRTDVPAVRGSAREKLLVAAHSVIGRHGIDGSTIAQIVAEAGVGVGSFYNHFATKEQLAREVFEAMTEELGERMRDVVLLVTDPAVATCFAIRTLIRQAEEDPVWAAFIAQLEPSHQMLDGLLRKYALVGLRLGTTSGRFEIDDPEVAVTFIHSIVVSVIQGLVRGELTSERAHRSAALPLRMLGVPKAEADKMARLPYERLLKQAGIEQIELSLARKHR
ncbi:hypothetical protein MNJPNG_08825 [Cupriavidus oxalaticus]|uniref:TetR/AcrR family transcriptional regulator n=1 Tax=Cupriavidus oxalaticus TaxID=96344 RepID=UPI003F73A723